MTPVQLEDDLAGARAASTAPLKGSHACGSRRWLEQASHAYFILACEKLGSSAGDSPRGA